MGASKSPAFGVRVRLPLLPPKTAKKEGEEMVKKCKEKQLNAKQKKAIQM